MFRSLIGHLSHLLSRENISVIFFSQISVGLVHETNVNSPVIAKQRNRIHMDPHSPMKSHHWAGF